MRALKDHSGYPYEIDITGQGGNAFAVLAAAQKIAREEGWAKDRIEKMIDDMKSSGYDHLIDVFERELGDLVMIYE